jgi:UDP-glucose:(heptosyl)LPS alpha-1,3-glucosyltransferase
MLVTFLRRNWSATGGAENYLRRLAGALQSRGHETRLVCETWDPGASPPFHNIKTLPRSLNRLQAPRPFADQANLHLMEGNPGLVFSMERGIKAAVYRAGDGLHAAWLRRRVSASPIRGRLRNVFNLKNLTVCDLERVTFHPDNTRAVIANSEMVKREILAFFPGFPHDRIHVLRNGVDAAYFGSGDRARGRSALGFRPEEIIVLLVGAGAERKGHAEAKRAVERLSARHTEFRLHIIDKPPPCSMPDAYAAADVFMLPTLYDPFANVTLEAMAAGLPVITSLSNGAGELITSGKNGFLVPSAKDTDEFAAYLLSLQDPERRRLIGQAGRDTASNHGLAGHAEATLRLLESLNA